MASVNPLLLPVRKDVETIRRTVLENIIKMLANRKWIYKENIQKKLDEVVKNQNDDNLYKISLDVHLGSFSTYDPQHDKFDDKKKKKEKDGKEINQFIDNTVTVKLLPQKVTSIGKSPIISEYISNYTNMHKILVVDNISDKSKHQLLSNRYLEIFEESFFMIDLLSHVCSPQYEILSPAETEIFLKSYNVTKNQMKKMLDSDAASQYLYVKRGQIVRIIRSSELTGEAIDYRIIVHRGL